MSGRVCILQALIFPAVARADDHFIQTQINGHLAYLISKEQAPEAMEWLQTGADATAILPPGDKRKIDGNWDLDEKVVTRADIQAFAFIQRGRADYAFAFPQWAKNDKINKDAAKIKRDALNEVNLVYKHRGDYLAQYFGYIIDGKKYIYCNYIMKGGPPFIDLSIRFLVVNDGGYGFWQIIYDVDSDTCSNLQINGPWVLDW